MYPEVTQEKLASKSKYWATLQSMTTELAEEEGNLNTPPATSHVHSVKTSSILPSTSRPHPPSQTIIPLPPSSSYLRQLS